MSETFEWPSQYHFPPFFTIQPNQETRKRQFEIWSSLILKYCKHNRMFILDKSANSIPLFHNGDIQRQLSITALETVLKDMQAKGLIEWVDSKEERCFVLWHPIAEWGDILYEYANSNGLANSVATFYELVNPEDPNEFTGMDYALLTRILAGLESRGKAELIDPDGITGGSSGTGKSLGVIAAKRGANVTILARDVSKLGVAAEEIRKYMIHEGQKVNYFKMDVTNSEETTDVLKRCEVEIGPIDIMVNCAGYSYPARFEDLPMEHIKGMMDINFIGTVNTTRYVVQSMKPRKSGHIVMVSSVAGLIGLYGYTGYSASKFALRGFAEALQMELKPFDISVTVAFPADVDTPGLQQEAKTKPKETKLIEGTAGLFTPEQVAESILSSTLMGDFIATTGFDSYIAGVATAGMSPVTSVFTTIFQICFLGIIRLVSLGYLFQFNNIVAKCAADKEKHKKAE